MELAEMVQDPEFRAQMREVVEFNAADRDHAAAAGRSVWFPMRLLRLGTEARARGIAPESPEAAALLREVLGTATRPPFSNAWSRRPTTGSPGTGSCCPR